MNNDALMIAGKAYNSRLLVGTGKYKDLEETRSAIEASGAEIVTVAIRRTNIGQNPRASASPSAASSWPTTAVSPTSANRCSAS